MNDLEATDLIMKLIEQDATDARVFSLWKIIDYINGLSYSTVTETVEILESLNQEDEDVKKLRGYLKL